MTETQGTNQGLAENEDASSVYTKLSRGRQEPRGVEPGSLPVSPTPAGISSERTTNPHPWISITSWDKDENRKPVT